MCPGAKKASDILACIRNSVASRTLESRAETKCLESLSPGHCASFLWAVWAMRGLHGLKGPMKLCRRIDSLSELFLETIYISLKLLCHLNA